MCCVAGFLFIDYRARVVKTAYGNVNGDNEHAGLAYVGLITIMLADVWQLMLKLRKAARKGWSYLFQT